jgi:hypothetical protein
MEFFKVPEALERQHDLIHEQLARAVAEGAGTGAAAKAVVEALRPHVAKEEDFGLPALGLLPHLVAGRVSPVMRGVIAMTDRLRTQYEQMLAEHEAIVVGALLKARGAKARQQPLAASAGAGRRSRVGGDHSEPASPAASAIRLRSSR